MTSSTGKELARGTGLMFTGALVYQLFEYLYRMLLARELGMEVFGTFNQARALFLVIATVSTLGLAQGARQFVAAARTEGTPGAARRAIRDGARMIVVTGLAGGALLYLLAGPCARLFHNAALAAPVRILAAGVPLSVGLVFAIHVAQAVRSYRAGAVAQQMVDPFLRFAFAAIVLATGAGLHGVLGGYVAAAFVSLLTAIAMVARLHPVRELARGPAPSRAGALLRYSLPLAFSYLVHGLAERIDILMIGYFLDEARVGLYASGSALARSLLILLASAMPVASTMAAECMGRGDRNGVAEVRLRIARWMFLLGAPIAAALLLFPEFIVTLLFGAPYAEGGQVLRLLVPGYFLSIVLGPLGSLVAAIDRTSWNLQNTLVRTGANVALNALWIPRYGLAGAAWATTVALTLGTLVYVLQLRSAIPFGPPFGRVGRAAAALAVAAGGGWAVARALAEATPFAPGAGIVVLAAAYAGALRWIPGCLHRDDLSLAASVARRLTGRRRR